MIKSNDESYLKRMCETHQCPEHGKKLTVAWHAGENAYVIRCGEGHFPEEIVKELSPLAEYKAGKREAHGPGLDLLPKTDLATGQLLTPDQVEGILDYAWRYKLDPFRGHVVLMYGHPYLSIDGYLWHANQTKIPYQMRSHPLDEEERKTYRIDENDHAWTCEVVLPLTDQSFTGLGVVTREEMTAMSTKNPKQLSSPVVAAHPWQLAQKRAEWQAMRRAFPIGESKEVNSKKGD